MTNQIRVRIDSEADAAYIVLSDKVVKRTVEVTESVLIDLDEFNIAVGVEVLEMGAHIPFGRLQREFHVHSDVVNHLRLIQPSVSGFLSFSQGADSASQTVSQAQPVYA